MVLSCRTFFFFNFIYFNFIFYFLYFFLKITSSYSTSSISNCHFVIPTFSLSVSSFPSFHSSRLDGLSIDYSSVYIRTGLLLFSPSSLFLPLFSLLLLFFPLLPTTYLSPSPFINANLPFYRVSPSTYSF